MHSIEKQPGVYIVVEGGETTGKSTLSFPLAQRYNAVLTRETGGTKVGEQIREILHNKSNSDLFWLTDALMTAADRAQHIYQIVAPAIESGQNVVSDRSWVSSLVYQALANDQDPSVIFKITELAIGRYMYIDELIILNIPCGEYVKRQTAKGHSDRFEEMGQEYHRKVLNGYLTVAQDLGALVIDASLPKREIFAIATAKIDKSMSIKYKEGSNNNGDRITKTAKP